MFDGGARGIDPSEYIENPVTMDEVPIFEGQEEMGEPTSSIFNTALMDEEEVEVNANMGKTVELAPLAQTLPRPPQTPSETASHRVGAGVSVSRRPTRQSGTRPSTVRTGGSDSSSGGYMKIPVETKVMDMLKRAGYDCGDNPMDVVSNITDKAMKEFLYTLTALKEAAHKDCRRAGKERVYNQAASARDQVTLYQKMIKEAEVRKELHRQSIEAARFDEAVELMNKKLETQLKGAVESLTPTLTPTLNIRLNLR